MTIMSVAEIAQYLRVDEGVVRRLIKQGSIPSFEVDGHPRVQYGSLVQWFQSETQARSLEMLRQQLQKPATWQSALEQEPELRDRLLSEEQKEGTFGCFLKEALLTKPPPDETEEQENLHKILEVLKNWQKSEKKDKDFKEAKSSLPPIAKTYEILCRYRGQCGAKTTDLIKWLGSASNNRSGYYPALLNNFASLEVITDLENWLEKSEYTRREQKDTKKEQEGIIEPKPPEILQKILWILMYGRRYWKLLSVAVIFFLFIWILPKINQFSKKDLNIKLGTETDKKIEDITLLYLFGNDFNNLLRAGEDRILTNKDGSQTTVKSKLYLDFESQTEFVGFYIPSVPETFDICIHLAEHYKTALELKKKVMVESSSIGLQPVNTSELKFSGRVFIYHEYPLLEAQKRELFAQYKKHDLSPQFRGIGYLVKKKQIEKSQ